MGCEECEKAHERGDVMPIRIGNKEFGWGTILIIGCYNHLRLAKQYINNGSEAILN